MQKEILHGSEFIIKKPELRLGKITNDYGQGFYCTLLPEMAKEWACKDNRDGFVNRYYFDDANLKCLNLSDGNHTVLNWIALLLKHRTFTIQDEIARDAREYIIDNFSIDTSSYDVIVGYRADDSYFSFAQSFVTNALPMRSLSRALRLGKLGEQTVLVSEKAFERIVFVDAVPVAKDEYYPKFLARDTEARRAFRDDLKKQKTYKDDIFIMDILREEMKNGDLRIQRIILE